MKSVVALILCCLALRASSQEMFNMDDLEEGFRWMVEAGEFTPLMQGLFPMLEMQICPVESSECNAMENWIFGCNCRKAFGALSDECKRKPCEAFRAFRDNGAQTIQSLLDSESTVEAMEILVDSLIEPFARSMCQCPSLIDATMTCFQKYDGMYFELAEMDRTVFDHVISQIDWNSLKKVAKVFMAEAWCGEGADGADCVDEMAKAYHVMAQFVDNTMAGEDVCMSGVRFAGKMSRYMDAITEFTSMDNFIDAYLDMEKAAMCDSECAEEVAKGFYSCCAKSAMETVTKKSNQKALIKAVKSIMPLISEDQKMPNIKKLMKVMNPEKFCGKKIDVYKRMNDACEAEEA